MEAHLARYQLRKAKESSNLALLEMSLCQSGLRDTVREGLRHVNLVLGIGEMIKQNFLFGERGTFKAVNLEDLLVSSSDDENSLIFIEHASDQKLKSMIQELVEFYSYVLKTHHEEVLS